MSRLDNLKLAYRKRESYLITFFGALGMGFLLFYFTHYDLVAGNMGRLYADVQVVLQILLALFFGVNLSLLWYKLQSAGKVSAVDGGTTTVASVLSIIVSGCPACGITLASYIGLATFFSALPLAGLELKLLGLGLLIYSTDDLTRKLSTCEVKLAVDDTADQ